MIVGKGVLKVQSMYWDCHWYFLSRHQLNPFLFRKQLQFSRLLSHQNFKTPISRSSLLNISPLKMGTLLGTNISYQKSHLKMIFLFPRWDMLIPWRVGLDLSPKKKPENMPTTTPPKVSKVRPSGLVTPSLKAVLAPDDEVVGEVGILRDGGKGGVRVARNPGG